MPKPNRSLLDIDANALDQEWLTQPGVVYNFGEAEADAKHEYAQAIAALKVLKAELAMKVRRTPTRFGFIKRPTKDEVDDTVQLSKRYQEGVKESLKLKHKVDILTVAREAMMDRRKGLENLVQLHLTNYHSEPKLPASEVVRARISSAPAPIYTTAIVKRPKS